METVSVVLTITVSYSGVAEREGGVDAGVVELDALADAVRAGAQDDDGRPRGARDLGFLVAGGVEARRLAANSAAQVSTVL